MGKEKIRIGNAGGYWGDDPEALYRQVTSGQLDYISIDFLAEVTMSILQGQRKMDPNLGYAKDFLGMLKGVLPQLLAKKIKIITNAGGINPIACARAITKIAEELELKPKVAVVMGDDILGDLDDLIEKGCSFANMETGAAFSPVRKNIEAANVYLGALPVVHALKSDPDIIVTGRVTDTGITLAAMIHEFSWSFKDYDKLAAGIVAGHILECGAQATGGNFSDWHKVPSFKDMGYPIAEVYSSGTFVITKHEKLGGLVSPDTIREQLFYEMGDPKAYITPDVVADFSTIILKDLGANRVEVSGIKGYESTPFYKVSMAYRDGYKSTGMIVISGPNARKKAEKFAEIFWQKCGTDFLETSTEYFGWNACHRTLTGHDDGNEIILRLGANDTNKDKLRKFGKTIPSLILSGPPGVTVAGGVPKIHDIVSYWPALMPKPLVTPKFGLFEADTVNLIEVTEQVAGDFTAQTDTLTQVAEKSTIDITQAVKEPQCGKDEVLVDLYTLCLGRSGDKGDTCNIGLIARSKEIFEFLDTRVTSQAVKNWFQELCSAKVIRYKLDNLQGYNFLLEGALGGGGTHSLRIDPQGKTFAQALLKQKIVVPKNLLATIKP